MIRLDMKEYSTEDSIAGIVGGGETGGSYLARRVQDRPFSLVLLDEIEKAHPKVLHLFLQVLDEGILNDRNGMKVDFKNTIIIATSNAGALFIRDYFRAHEEFDKSSFKVSLIDTVLKEKHFSPEFLNRFDDVILYQPLTHGGAEACFTAGENVFWQSIFLTLFEEPLGLVTTYFLIDREVGGELHEA